ncbi:MAG: hypothetical protein RRY41_10065 [Burkholderiaceae bacterium]
MKPVIRVLDHGTELAIDFDACVAYHGRTSIGGLALGFRLLQWAIGELSPNQIPDRQSIRLRTAFPGPGLRDAFEMLARVVTRGAYEVLPPAAAPAAAPVGVTGRMYFQVWIGQRHLDVVLPAGTISAEFIELGRAVKSGQASPAQDARWTELKEALARTVWAADPAALFVLVG